jgi:hypothetical protein
VFSECLVKVALPGMDIGLRSGFGGYAMHKKGDHLIACMVLVDLFR